MRSGGTGVVGDRSSIGLDLQAVLVVPKRDGDILRRRVDGSDRDHAMGRAVDGTEHAPAAQIDRVQHTVEDEISDVAVAPRRPGHGPVEEIAVFPYPTSRLAQRSGGVGGNLAGRRRADAQQEATAVGDDLGQQVDDVEPGQLVLGSFGPVVPEAEADTPSQLRGFGSTVRAGLIVIRTRVEDHPFGAECRHEVGAVDARRWRY